MLKKFIKFIIIVNLVIALQVINAKKRKINTTDEVRNKVNAILLQEEIPIELKEGFEILISEGERNLVLNSMRLGLDAFQLNYFDIAGKLLDIAIEGIETIYANNPRAIKARKLWYEEGMKDFKGEPYERVMAYYYRGLLYMLEGKYEDAGICFRNGILQDAFAEEQQYRCDFALLYFLEGWCWQKMNQISKAEESFKEFKEFRPDAPVPSLEDNVLFIIETGPAPRKLADGIGHYELKIFRGKGERAVRVVLYNNDKEIKVYPMEDIAWQAMTRGGRKFDKILYGQAQFKQDTAATASFLTESANNAMLASSLMRGSASSNMQGVAAGMAVVGSLVTIASIKAKPRADTRYWDNLPETIHIAFLKLSPGVHQVKIKFFDKENNELTFLEKQIEFNVPSTGEKIIYIRSPLNLKYVSN